MKIRGSIGAIGAHGALALVLLGAVAALALGGCDAAPAWPPAPAEVALGEDACDACRMIVSDGRFAAQLRTRDGAVRFYDDAGCLLAAVAKMDPRPDPAGIFVRTFDGSGRWASGLGGYVVESEEIPSPMGFGLAAFVTRAEAEAATGRWEGARVRAIESLIANEGGR